MICKKCGKEFPKYLIIDGVRHNLSTRKHCLECVPFNSNNRVRKTHGFCVNCGLQLIRSDRKYCSNKCQQEYLYKEYIYKWKIGEVDGLIGNNWIDVSNYIKRYLLEKYDYKCSKCGWSEINPYTKTLPLEIEHIDGNAMNNKEENLTLLCPNCHSLTNTYRGANKNKSTRGIKWVARNGNTNKDN